MALMTSPPYREMPKKKQKQQKTPIVNMFFSPMLSYDDAAFALNPPLRAERTPPCPGFDFHALLFLSSGCKWSSLGGFHSLGKLSRLWTHTLRMMEQQRQDPIFCHDVICILHIRNILFLWMVSAISTGTDDILIKMLKTSKQLKECIIWSKINKSFMKLLKLN